MTDSSSFPPPDPPLPEQTLDAPKAKKHLHVVPHEDDVIAQEMAELFEEDQVTHKHGSAEPEGD